MSFCADLIVTRMGRTGANEDFGRCELVRLFNSLQTIPRAAHVLQLADRPSPAPWGRCLTPGEAPNNRTCSSVCPVLRDRADNFLSSATTRILPGHSQAPRTRTSCLTGEPVPRLRQALRPSSRNQRRRTTGSLDRILAQTQRERLYGLDAALLGRPAPLLQLLEQLFARRTRMAPENQQFATQLNAGAQRRVVDAGAVEWWQLRRLSASGRRLLPKQFAHAAPKQMLSRRRRCRSLAKAWTHTASADLR